MQRDSLECILKPKNVAVIGATEKEGSVGRTIVWNLLQNSFGGALFPVNPKRNSVLGVKCYPNVGSIPTSVDLAVVVVPASFVPGIIRECVQAKIPGAIIISAGFREAGEEGLLLENQVREEASKGEIRIIGPNCLGVMMPLLGLNATFASKMARPGRVAFISQSGALCTAILDWSMKENVGFSAFMSIGSMLDVGWGDLIDCLGKDPATQSILLYMESIGDAKSFLSAAREVALKKPIIVIKAGSTEAAAKAAASHTGTMAGSDRVLSAAFKRIGVLRVERISDLFHMAEVLSKQPAPKGPRLTLLTNAGGPGVLATDALIKNGGELAVLSPNTVTQLNAFLPTHWSHANPIDILGDADPERYAKALEVAAKDPNSDGLLVILTPQAMTDPTQTAETLKNHAHRHGKPVIASWMGGSDVAAGETILNQADIPTFSYPDTAAQVFEYMWKYSDNLRAVYETPVPSPEENIPDRAKVAALLSLAKQEGRTILTEEESKQILQAYHIPTVPTEKAFSETEAVSFAEKMGFPVVLKLLSKTLTHKTDVGGVQLNLGDKESVRKAYRSIESAVRAIAGAGHFEGVTVQPMIKTEGYEIILGSSQDAQFGPVLLFGAGGQLVEVLKDSSVGLPPLNTTLAKKLMQETRIFKALLGVRGRPPVDLEKLAQILVRFSQLVTEEPWIKEIDINPLLVSHERLIALDARVLLFDSKTQEHELPKPAIRPYPIQYQSSGILKNGEPVIFRPIRAEDEPLMVAFHGKLSERTVYLRYTENVSLSERISHERLTRICFIDYDREIALVAERSKEILGVSRIRKSKNLEEAELFILVRDDCQGLGLGSELLKRTLDISKNEGVKKLTAQILPDNAGMKKLCEKFGFRISKDDVSGKVSAKKNL